MDRLLDSGRTGPLYLARPEVANVVVEAILFREQQRQYTLHAWVVMSNHVHLLMTPNLDVSKLMHSLKRHTARECNRILNQTGQPFWQEESFDRLVRDRAEFHKIARYIEWNPVNADLAETPEAHPYSSGRPIAHRPRVANPPHRFC